MTFLQAKLEEKPKTSLTNFNFRGDFYQYELLADRPDIISSGNCQFPKNILSNAILDSVGSYGIFYRDIKNRFDFAFSTAKDIFFNTNKNYKLGNRQFFLRNLSFNNFRIEVNKKEIELRQTLNADCFEFCLLNLLVGTPIEKDNSVLNFLKNSLVRFTKSNEVIENFSFFLNSILEDNVENFDFEVRNMPYTFLINVDGRQQARR